MMCLAALAVGVFAARHRFDSSQVLPVDPHARSGRPQRTNPVATNGVGYLWDLLKSGFWLPPDHAFELAAFPRRGRRLI